VWYRLRRDNNTSFGSYNNQVEAIRLPRIAVETPIRDRLEREGYRITRYNSDGSGAAELLGTGLE